MDGANVVVLMALFLSRENQRKDAELHQLLSTSKLLEEYRKYMAYVMFFGYDIDS